MNAFVDLIRRNKKFKLRVELQYMCRLMELVAFFELEKYDVIESAAVALLRFLERHDRLDDFMRSTVRQLRRYHQQPVAQQESYRNHW